MSRIPTQLRYTKSHEWVQLEADGSVTVGITDHAQELLGDLVYIELPEVGRRIKAEESAAVVESVKAAQDIYSPLAGSISAVNRDLANTPQLVNEDPYSAWFFRLTPDDPAELQSLLDASGYAKLIG